MRFNLGILDSGERSFLFRLLVFEKQINKLKQNLLQMFSKEIKKNQLSVFFIDTKSSLSSLVYLSLISVYNQIYTIYTQ